MDDLEKHYSKAIELASGVLGKQFGVDPETARPVLNGALRHLRHGKISDLVVLGIWVESLALALEAMQPNGARFPH